MALSIASAHHLVAFLQAVPQAALHVEPGVGQLLWLSLHTLHLHMLATLTPVLEVRCMGCCKASIYAVGYVLVLH